MKSMLANKNKKAAVFNKIATLIVIFSVLGLNSFAQYSFTIISNSKSDYHIIVPPNAPAIATEAANTLQSYLSKISGCTLPITKEAVNVNAKQLIVGNTNVLQRSDTSGLGRDGVLIKKIGPAIVFAGGYRKGVLYSVYMLLDSLLHCKMYAQDAVQIPQ